MLHRLVSYVNSSLDYKLKGHIGDSIEDINLTLFSDADFAGCLDTYCEVYIRCVYCTYRS